MTLMEYLAVSFICVAVKIKCKIMQKDMLYQALYYKLSTHEGGSLVVQLNQIWSDCDKSK